VAASRDDRRHERNRREGQQQKQQYLGEDDPDRERAQEQDRAELAAEEDERQQQPLELAARLHRVGRGLVGDPEPVAAPCGVGVRQLRGIAVVQRVVLGAAIVLAVGAEAEAQEVRRVLIRVVDADLAVSTHLGPARQAVGKCRVSAGA
jgi:hypothetical protein